MAPQPARLFHTLLLLILLSTTLFAQEPSLSNSSSTLPSRLPALRIDRENRCLEIEARVIRREGKWLEQLLCTPNTREHESILLTEARPSHVHLALLLLGLEPGSPMTVTWHNDQPTILSPRGPALRITIRYRQGDQTIEVPANHWILNQQTQQPLDSNLWLFAGSRFHQLQPPPADPAYAADLSGSLITLVNFGDDCLARDTTLTNRNDQAIWGPNTPLIPPPGTPVILRLIPADLSPSQPAATPTPSPNPSPPIPPQP